MYEKYAKKAEKLFVSPNFTSDAFSTAFDALLALYLKRKDQGLSFIEHTMFGTSCCRRDGNDNYVPSADMMRAIMLQDIRDNLPSSSYCMVVMHTIVPRRGVSFDTIRKAMDGTKSIDELTRNIPLEKLCKDVCMVFKQSDNIHHVFVARSMAAAIFSKMVSVIHVLCQNNFNEFPLDGNENAMLKALAEDDTVTAAGIVARIFDEFNFQHEDLVACFSGLGDRIISSEKENCERQIRDHKRRIKNFEESIAESWSCIEKYQATLFGLAVNKENIGKFDEVIDFIERNDSVWLDSFRNDTFVIGVSSYLDYIDEGVFDTYFGTPAKFARTDFSGISRFSDEETVAMLRALFIGGRYKINTHAYYAAREEYHYMFEATLGERPPNSYPNPHIAQYSCIGQYRTLFRECAENFDMLGQINAAMASCSSLNLTDHTVIYKFFRQVFGEEEDYGKFIVDTQTGEIFNIREFNQKIKEDEK